MNNQTYFKLKQLRLSGMADVYQELVSDHRNMQALSVDEILELMVDRELNRRLDSKHERLLKRAAFEQPQAHITIGCARRGIDQDLLAPFHPIAGDAFDQELIDPGGDLDPGIGKVGRFEQVRQRRDPNPNRRRPVRCGGNQLRAFQLRRQLKTKDLVTKRHGKD